LAFQADKTGYYPFQISYHMGRNYKSDKWNPTQIVVLKQIIKPIPMYAKHIEGGPPVFNEPAGFDLTIGDWVAPLGRGQSADVIFTGSLDQKAKDDFDYKLTISFPNPGDGIQVFSAPAYYLHSVGSKLRSDEYAPLVGYETQVVRTLSRHPGLGTTEGMNNPERNYYFRVRTKLDTSGNIVSTHYGKIYGDFMQFSYYLNPTPNDRGLEFNLKDNLITNLNDREGVNAP
jgi:hypothetical protein